MVYTAMNVWYLGWDDRYDENPFLGKKCLLLPVSKSLILDKYGMDEMGIMGGFAPIMEIPVYVRDTIALIRAESGLTEAIRNEIRVTLFTYHEFVFPF
jgi:hypothetical protein